MSELKVELCMNLICNWSQFVDKMPGYVQCTLYRPKFCVLTKTAAESSYNYRRSVY